LRHFAGWIVVRTILVADVALLVVAGFMSLLWVSRPAGFIAAGAMWLVAGGLLGLLPLTDRYRAEERWYRKHHPVGNRSTLPKTDLSGWERRPGA
jgi:hypothetical protein